MPIPTPDQTGAPDVPSQIYDRFLEDLARKAVPAEIIARLRKTFVEQKIMTEAALKAAIFSEEALP